MWKFLAISCAAALPALCGDWNPRLAADYLDAQQKAWFAWKPAQATGGPCFSCHTGMTYLLARPALRRALGEKEPTQYETGLMDALRARVDKKTGKEIFAGFSREPVASQALGVEAVFAALFLSSDGAFDRLWSLQSHDEKTSGAWSWFSLDLDPWEMPESRFYGATLAALAAGSAPAQYQNKLEVRENVESLAAYLRREQASQPLHNRLMLLWASSKLPTAMPASVRQPLLDEIKKAQREDGGWTIASLGPWKERTAAPASTGSNAYATAFTAFALQRAGMASSDPTLARALTWLKTHQDPKTGYWEAQSMNKVRDPASIPAGFMRDAATAFASLALIEAGGASVEFRSIVSEAASVVR